MFYCFYFSFRCHSRWNRCAARLPDWKPLAPLSFWLIPRRPPRLWARQPGDPVPLWHPTSREKRSSAAGCRQVSSFPHDTAIMVPPSLPDDMSVTHGGKSISCVWRESGYVCWQGSDIHPQFRTRGLEFIITLHNSTCHQAVGYNNKLFLSFMCVCVFFCALCRLILCFIHVCWSSLLYITSVWACHRRMRNLLGAQTRKSVPMCSRNQCQLSSIMWPLTIPRPAFVAGVSF